MKTVALIPIKLDSKRVPGKILSHFLMAHRLCILSRNHVLMQRQ